MSATEPTLERYVLLREAIPADRWEKAYGWPPEQAQRMDGTGSDVRLYHVDDGGVWHEIDGHIDSQFEFGYGGTGPHNSARAIVAHALGTDAPDRWPPADLREVVPEVFAASHEDRRCLVLASAVKERLAAKV